MFFKKEFYRLEERNIKLQDEIKSLESERFHLKQKVEDIKIELKNLELKKKIDDEDIKHLVKMEKEKMEITKERFLIEKEREFQAKLDEQRNIYQNKLVSELQNQITNIKEMYAGIVKLLPDVNVRLKA